MQQDIERSECRDIIFSWQNIKQHTGKQKMSSYYVMFETLKHWETTNVELLCYAGNTETLGNSKCRAIMLCLKHGNIGKLQMSSYYVMLETLKHWETANVELLCYV